MTIFDVINFNRELICRLRICGIRLEDAQYINLFVEFNLMVANGDKVSYAVARLADDYNISERKVYTLIKRFQSHCNPDAV